MYVIVTLMNLPSCIHGLFININKSIALHATKKAQIKEFTAHLAQCVGVNIHEFDKSLLNVLLAVSINNSDFSGGFTIFTSN